MRIRLLKKFRSSERGATAAEFALVLPVVVLLCLGSIGFMMMMAAMSGLHFAVEDAARCAAVNKTVCSSDGATKTYATGRYSGPTISGLTFTSTATGCGRRVTATGTINFVGLPVTAPVSAVACYPNQST
jgi:Flp pilus assembly protein TadG